MSDMERISILIIGTIPPPVGGVTIYVQRLLSQLQKNAAVKTDFFDYKRMPLLRSPKYILKARLVHVNVSNPVLLFLFCFISKVLLRKVIITYHGNISGRSAKASFFNRLSLLLATYPILLNDTSFKTALRYNRRAIRSTAFIPPESEALKETLYNNLTRVRNAGNYQLVFCTNAFDVSFDAQKAETYGISDIINIFNSLPHYLLIFSDPSGNYKRYLEAKGITTGKNIFIIDEIHPFIEIIKLSDAMIRATTTDGDSISVREALYYKKQVIASDCVSRPEGVVLYRTKDWKHLSETISTISNTNPGNNYAANAMDDINQLIKKTISNK